MRKNPYMVNEPEIKQGIKEILESFSKIGSKKIIDFSVDQENYFLLANEYLDAKRKKGMLVSPNEFYARLSKIGLFYSYAWASGIDSEEKQGLLKLFLGLVDKCISIFLTWLVPHQRYLIDNVFNYNFLYLVDQRIEEIGKQGGKNYGEFGPVVDYFQQFIAIEKGFMEAYDPSRFPNFEKIRKNLKKNKK